MQSILEHFFQGYFHQDWSLDYPTTLDGVRFFKSRETEERVLELASELGTLIGETEPPQTLIYDLGGEFRPEVENMTVNEWLKAAIKILEE